MSRVPVYVKRGAFLSGSDLDTGQVVQIFFLSLTHRLFHSLDSSFCTLCSSSSSPLFFFPPVSLPFASAAGSTWVYPLVLLDSSSLQVQLLIKETQVFQSRVRREHIKKEQRERERERKRKRKKKRITVNFNLDFFRRSFALFILGNQIVRAPVLLGWSFNFKCHLVLSLGHFGNFNRMTSVFTNHLIFLEPRNFGCRSSSNDALNDN